MLPTAMRKGNLESRTTRYSEKSLATAGLNQYQHCKSYLIAQPGNNSLKRAFLNSLQGSLTTHWLFLTYVTTYCCIYFFCDFCECELHNLMCEYKPIIATGCDKIPSQKLEKDFHFVLFNSRTKRVK